MSSHIRKNVFCTSEQNSVILPIGGSFMGKTPLLTYQAETALAWSLEVLKQYPR